MRTDILECKEQILSWIDEGRSKAFIAKELHCKQETLNRYIARMEIKYDGNQSGKGMPKPRSDKMNLTEYLKNSKDIQTNKVRIKLLEEGYKEYKCECCGLTTWLNEPIPLELHHKDGDRTNNTLENFQLLCPNCHALTSNYRGRAHLSALSEKRDVECRKFKEALTGSADGNLEPSLRTGGRCRD